MAQCRRLKMYSLVAALRYLYFFRTVNWFAGPCQVLSATIIQGFFKVLALRREDFVSAGQGAAPHGNRRLGSYCRSRVDAPWQVRQAIRVLEISLLPKSRRLLWEKFLHVSRW